MGENIGEFVQYNSDSGVFIYKKKTNNRVHIGDIVGSYSGVGYLAFQFKKKKIYLHRLAWLLYYGEEPDGFIDHINGVRDDNRIENLRVVSKLENHKNMKKPNTNTSGVIGVHWDKSKNRWIAKIKVEQKSYNLGHFVEFSDAVNARKNAEVLYGFHTNHGRDK